MISHEYRGPHPLHQRIEELEREVDRLTKENKRLNRVAWVYLQDQAALNELDKELLRGDK